MGKLIILGNEFYVTHKIPIIIIILLWVEEDCD